MIDFDAFFIDCYSFPSMSRKGGGFLRRAYLVARLYSILDLFICLVWALLFVLHLLEFFPDGQLFWLGQLFSGGKVTSVVTCFSTWRRLTVKDGEWTSDFSCSSLFLSFLLLSPFSSFLFFFLTLAAARLSVNLVHTAAWK